MPESPFAVLGLAPTLDAGAIKRAWFTALQKHPPHTDPAGFRRIRDAYEALSAPDRLDVAYASAPVDIDAELARLGARFDAGLAAARAVGLQARAQESAGRRFREVYSRLSLSAAVALASRA